MRSEYDEKYLSDEQKRTLDTADELLAEGVITEKDLHDTYEFQRNQAGYSGGDDGSQYIKLDQTNGGKENASGQAPTSIRFNYRNGSDYTSKWDEFLDTLMSDYYKNRKAFSYDHTTDPTYQALAKQYQKGGQTAMNDTYATVASKSGGLASSYAASAAQQSYNRYMDELSNKIPELEQLAYEKYMNERNMQLADINLAATMSDRAYSRWSDDWNRQNTLDQQNYQKNYTSQENAKKRIYDMMTIGGLSAEEVMAQEPWLFDTSGLTASDLYGYQNVYTNQKGQDDYNKAYTAQENAKKRIYEMLASGISADQIRTQAANLLEVSGLGDLDLLAGENSYASQLSAQQSKTTGGGKKPSMSLATAKLKAENGQWTDEVLQAFYDEDWDDDLLEAVYGYEPVKNDDSFSVDYLKEAYKEQGLDFNELSAQTACSEAGLPYTAENLMKLVEQGIVVEDHYGGNVKFRLNPHKPWAVKTEFKPAYK